MTTKQHCTPPRFRPSRFHGVQQVLNCFCISVYRVTRENVDHPDGSCSVASLHRLQRMKLESPPLDTKQSSRKSVVMDHRLLGLVLNREALAANVSQYRSEHEESSLPSPR